MTTTKTSDQSNDQPMPTNVVAALARVMADLGGVEKLTPDERRRRGLGGGDGGTGINYAYRGIDQIASAAQPLLARYGVVMIPEVTSVRVVDIVVNGRPWTDTFIDCNWHVYGPGGITDVIHGATSGSGRDNSDKGVNKATTSAFKNMLLRLLCIGDPADDTEHDRFEADAPVAPAPPPANAAAAALFDRLRDMGAAKHPAVPALKAWAVGQGSLTYSAFDADAAWMDAVVERLDGLLAEAAQDASTDSEAP